MGTWLLSRGPDARRILLLVAIVGVPVIFVRSGIDPFNVPKVALLITVVVLTAALRGAEWLQGLGPSPLMRAWRPAAALAAPLLLSWIFSSQKSWALFGLFGRFQGLIPYLLVLLLALLAAEAFEGKPEWAAWGVAAAATFVGGYALLQVVEADPFTWDAFGAPTKAISSLGNPNFTGGFLGMALPLFAGLAVFPHPRRKLARQLAVVAVAGWVMARSQGGYAGGVAGLAVTGGLLLSKRWGWTRILGLLAAGSIAAIVVAVGFIGAAKPGLPFIPSTVELRGEWWTSAIEMGLDSPLVGRGPNMYGLEGVGYRTVDDARQLGFDFTDDPHSVPFTLFANTGLLGLAGFVFIAWWVVTRISRVAANDVVSAALGGALVAYLIQALVSIDEISLRVTFWALLGAFVASLATTHPSVKPKKGQRELRESKKKRVQARPLRAIPGVVALGLVGITALVGAGMFLAADGKAGAGRSSYQVQDAQGGAGAFRSALSLRNERYYSYLWGLDAADAAIDEEGGTFEVATEAFSYLDEFPDVRGLVGYGRFLHQWAETHGSEFDLQAVEVYERALAIDDRNPAIRGELGEVLLALDEFERAIDVLEPGAEVAGNSAFSEVWGELALARAEIGDEGGAREAATIALAIKADEQHALEAMELIGDAGG